jgi:hypothetical protein
MPVIFHDSTVVLGVVASATFSLPVRHKFSGRTTLGRFQLFQDRHNSSIKLESYQKGIYFVTVAQRLLAGLLGMSHKGHLRMATGSDKKCGLKG